MKKAIVIVPTYNESKNIPRVIPALFEVFKKVANWDMHVLVVDDNSPDKTYDVVKNLQKKYPRLHLLVKAKKAGLGAAYLAGMDQAFHDLKADVVFEFDADLSHDPTKIPEFIHKIDAGYDMVLGSRYIPGGSIPEDWGWNRKFLSIVGNLVIMFVFTDFSIRDWTSGYRAITKKVYQAVLPQLQGERFQGYTFQVVFLYNAVRSGFKITEVPYHFADRTEGVSKIGPEYIKNNLIFIFKVRIQEIINHRIFKFAFVGGIGALVQLGSLMLWRKAFPYQLAFFLAIETAIVSNFLWNNLWTFSDRRLALPQVPAKFLQFNLASAGSIVIQQAIALIGEFAIGLFTLFTLPIINLKVDTGTIYAVVGILIGMFWNFFAYSKFIWKANK